MKGVSESAEVSHNNRRRVIGRVASFGGKKTAAPAADVMRAEFLTKLVFDIDLRLQGSSIINSYIS